MTPQEQLQKWKNKQPIKLKENFFKKLQDTKTNNKENQNRNTFGQKIINSPKNNSLNPWEKLPPNQRILVLGISVLTIVGLIVLSLFWFTKDETGSFGVNNIVNNYNNIANGYLNGQNQSVSKLPIALNNRVVTPDYGIFLVLKDILPANFEIQFVNSSQSINSDFESVVLSSKLIVNSDSPTNDWMRNYLVGKDYQGKTIELGADFQKLPKPQDNGQDYDLLDDASVDEGQIQAIDRNYFMNFGNIKTASEKLIFVLTQNFPTIKEQILQNNQNLKQNLEVLEQKYYNLQFCQNKDLLTFGNSFGYLASQYSLIYIPIELANPDQLQPQAAIDIKSKIQDFGLKNIYIEKLIDSKNKQNLENILGIKVYILNNLNTPESPDNSITKALEYNLVQFRAGFGCGN